MTGSPHWIWRGLIARLAVDRAQLPFGYVPHRPVRGDYLQVRKEGSIFMGGGNKKIHLHCTRDLDIRLEGLGCVREKLGIF